VKVDLDLEVEFQHLRKMIYIVKLMHI